jgi:hypothetical protein
MASCGPAVPSYRDMAQRLAVEGIEASWITVRNDYLAMKLESKETRKRRTLCANMTETSCVTAISKQGGKENQHGKDERFCPARGRCDGSI